MTLRLMTLEDLNTVLGWAADEGWNPGLDDAGAFLAADPEGFFVKELRGAPVAAISVVNHSADFAFLGLYLCKPEFRGQGHGMDVWRAGLARSGTRCVGLDGVPDQQENYARSGFVRLSRTIRYEGRSAGPSGPDTRPVSPSEALQLIEHDARATGVRRNAFASVWFSETPSRQTRMLINGSQVTGFATYRRCQIGTKIGPLYATRATDAATLLHANPFAASDPAVFVDVQDHNPALGTLLEQQGFEPVFETARMFTGPPPDARPDRFQAIATMELG